MSKGNINPNVYQINKSILPFKEAVEQAGFGIFNYVLILIGGLVLSNGFLETASIGFILPVAGCDLNMNNSAKGVLSVIGFVGIIVSSHLWGFLSDTKGRRAVILPTLIVGYVVTVVSNFSTHLWMLAMLRFINGFCISGSSATIYAYVGEFHTKRTRSRVIMASAFILAILGIMLPVISWGIINQNWSLPISFIGISYAPWRLFMLVCGTPGIVGGLVMLLYPESPKFLLTIGKEKEAIEVLKKMHKWNLQSGSLQIDGIIPERDIIVRNSTKSGNFCHLMWTQTIQIFKPNFLRCTLIICIIQFWMYVVFGVMVWFPYLVDVIVRFENNNPHTNFCICDVTYLKNAKHGKELEKTLEVSAYFYSLITQTLIAVGFAVVGFIVNKVQKSFILFVILVIFGACGVAAVNIPDLRVALWMNALFFISLVGVQLLSAITAELYPTHLRGMALCISLMAGHFGAIFGSNNLGLLLDSNCKLSFHIPGFALFFCAFLAFLIPKQLKFNNAAKV